MKDLTASLSVAVLASAGLAAAAPPPAAAGQLSFHRVDAVVGSPTTAILARDLNGNGRLDLDVEAIALHDDQAMARVEAAGIRLTIERGRRGTEP